jgi:hypothetical protein
MRLPSPELLWERHETFVLNVFMIALSKLQNQANLPEDEPSLNNLLYILVRDSWCKLPQHEKPIWSLICNAENIPSTTDEIGQEWTRKKPDFRWSLSDSQEKDSLKAIKDYTIECKRLREMSNRNFINQYVTEGIFRFLAKEYKYGNGTTSGAMIGYIQEMKHSDVLEQINAVIQKTGAFFIPIIEFDNSQNIDNIKKGNHTLERHEVDPPNFDLRHIWILMPNR